MKKVILGMSAMSLFVVGTAVAQVKSFPLSFREYEQKQPLPIKIIWFSKMLESGKFEKLKNIDNAEHLECLNQQVKEIEKAVQAINMDDKQFIEALSSRGIKSLSFSFTHNENMIDPDFSVSMMSIENSAAAINFGMSLAEDEKSTICKPVKQEAIQYTLKEKFGLSAETSISTDKFKKVGIAPKVNADKKVDDSHRGLTEKTPKESNIPMQSSSAISK